MMRNLSVKHYIAFLAAAVSLYIAACAGTAVISDELSPAELIQRAQEASDRNRYNLALQYYQAILDRYFTNIDLVCAAEYEIGFIHYKQKKYTQARAELNTLLERYTGPDEELLPQQFKRLATIVLERITEKEKPRFPFTLFQKNAAGS
jgi:outer membrane protein assembly factor BamD (BamD/ComL family)